MSPSLRFLALCFSMAGWTLVVGCSDSDRQSIEGTVTLDGQPLPSGSIIFVPQPGTESPTAGGKIEDGKFSVSSQKGIFAGEFGVQITATRPTGKKSRDPRTGVVMEDHEQYLPARYNTASELKVEVRAGAPNRFEFPMVSH